MRLFMTHYGESGRRSAGTNIELDPVFDIVCEEEDLDPVG
jgi:hypothetical protein